MCHVALLTSPSLSVWVKGLCSLAVITCTCVPIVVSHFKGMKHEHCELHVQYIAAEKLYFDILVSNYIVSV